MKPKKEKNNLGFTLIEMMMAASLLSIFSIFLVSLVLVTQRALLINNTAVPVRFEAKQVLESMLKEIRAADPYPSPNPAATITGTGNSQAITFRIPNQVTSSGPISWRQIQFSHNAGAQEVIRTENAVNTVIGRNVTSLTFALANNSIASTVGTQRTMAGGTTTIQLTLTGQGKLRN